MTAEQRVTAHHSAPPPSGARVTMPATRSVGAGDVLRTLNALDHDLARVRDLAADLPAVGLDEIEGAELLSRIDTKYLVRRPIAIDLIDRLAADSLVLDVGGCRLTTYDTHYLDTPHLDLYHAHQTERGRRTKVRRRRYVQSDATFFEVKIRRNTGRTDKQRIVGRDLSGPLTATEERLLTDTQCAMTDQLGETASTTFQRLTLVARDRSERLTIDFGLTVATPTRTVRLPDIVVVEVKRATRSRTTGANAGLRAAGVRPGSVSKYCLAIALGFDDVRQNRLKPALLALHRLAARPFLIDNPFDQPAHPGPSPTTNWCPSC